MPATILIVEDHEEVRGSLENWLMLAFPTCHVLEAASAEAALLLIQRESPDLVVMDISKPGMSGIEATRRIKAALPAVQVVILTIHQDAIYRADSMAAASAFISKQSMQAELIPTLAGLLGGNVS